MTGEMRNRLREAKKYQKMAVYALFPESTAKHIAAMEEEMKNMLLECAAELVKKGANGMREFQENAGKTPFCREEKEKTTAGKTKKVIID